MDHSVVHHGPSPSSPCVSRLTVERAHGVSATSPYPFLLCFSRGSALADGELARGALRWLGWAARVTTESWGHRERDSGVAAGSHRSGRPVCVERRRGRHGRGGAMHRGFGKVSMGLKRLPPDTAARAGMSGVAPRARVKPTDGGLAAMVVSGVGATTSIGAKEGFLPQVRVQGEPKDLINNG